MLSRIRDPRVLALLVLGGALIAVALLAPHPAPQQVRDWADSVGPLFPLVFFAVHAIVTVAPFPRTVFTLSAGLLFGPVLGITVAVAATTLSAILALLLVRALDRDQVAARLTHPAVRAVDRRLERRGWLAVGSLRLIAPVPFSVINYCAGLSSVRMLPYLLATIVGILPGTIGVVVLGDALTGRTEPGLLVLSGVCITIGVLGLVVDARWGADKFAVAATPTEPQATAPPDTTPVHNATH
ncbi:TVP38/TMEM64 family protein [Nocardia mexicana]|uniref:TVP38/TMEM64 family membrane protein n=1 Tax=Nocardia mexicana TaxID=279262 RepID=A0A370HEE2_9NOCA|nr:TVP38/TMEM64 family protein [Nocardia mexicana]RDI55617.1 putative membrane protein YdjX (TVP38/TMEM64 family) [Nocardia mexicana]